jgi:hypothetical protein
MMSTGPGIGTWKRSNALRPVATATASSSSVHVLRAFGGPTSAATAVHNQVIHEHRRLAWVFFG